MIIDLENDPVGSQEIIGNTLQCLKSFWLDIDSETGYFLSQSYLLCQSMVYNFMLT